MKSVILTVFIAGRIFSVALLTKLCTEDSGHNLWTVVCNYVVPACS